MLAGFLLRIAPWGQNRFLEDESLYAYWGLQIATGADPMLDREPVDKPPLHPYLLALSFSALGRPLPERATGLWLAETAARLPSLAASMAGIALVYALARRLAAISPPRGVTRTAGRELWPVAAALLVALSPFDILFASTAFTDPLMTALVLAATLAAAKGRLGVAGLLAGLAFATKQQAILFVPLVAAVGWLAAPALDQAVRSVGPTASPGQVAPDRSGVFHRGHQLRLRRGWAWLGLAFASPFPSLAGPGATKAPPGARRQGDAEVSRRPGRLLAGQSGGWVLLVLAFAAVAGGAFWWDAARAQRPGFLGQSLVSYGGLAPARLQDLGQRALGWLSLLGDFWVSPAASGLLAAAVTLWGVGGAAGRWARWRGVDVALAATVLGVLSMHWLVGFQVWDRYLLALVPLCALLAARALAALSDAIHSRPWRRLFPAGLLLVLVATLVGPAAAAAASRVPVGGDHGAYDGIEDMAAYVRETVPPGAVLYHYWLGYHYRFYLYGANLRMHWYPDLDDLAEDAVIYRREPRFIAFPSWQDGGPAAAALAEAGVRLEEVFEARRRDGTVSFRLYRLVGPPVAEDS